MSRWSAPLRIWHIFRKDFQLLWPVAAAILVCQVARLLVYGREESLGLPPLVSDLLTFVIVTGSALLIVLAVQQEPIPGSGQDWLVRPIRRRDLFLAKLLFVLLAIHVPLLAAALLYGLWEGLPLSACLASGLRQHLGLLLFLSLPPLAAGALTRTLTEAVVSSIVVFIAAIVVLLLTTTLVVWITGVPMRTAVTLGSGIAWVWGTLSQVLLVAVIAAVLTLLYTKRTILTARILFCTGLLAAAMVLFLPWSPAFALQRWLSPVPGGLGGISVTFEPSRAPPSAAAQTALKALELVNIPLHFRYAGVSAGTVLQVDHSAIRVLDESGQTVYHGTGMGNPFPSRTAGEPLTRNEQLLIPAGTWRRLMDRPVRLEIEQSMTVLRLRTLPPLPAATGSQRVPGVGRCATRLDRTGTAIETRCMAAGDVPDCLSMTLALPAGAQNPPWFQCNPSYAPWRIQPSLDVVSRLAARLPFNDPTDRVRYPVDASRLQEAHLVLTLYEPAGHLVNRIEVPAARLRDLVGQSVQGAQPGQLPRAGR